jgi:hypothetical protein
MAQVDKMVPDEKPFDWTESQTLDDIPHYDRSQKRNKEYDNIKHGEMVLVPNML